MTLSLSLSLSLSLYLLLYLSHYLAQAVRCPVQRYNPAKSKLSPHLTWEGGSGFGETGEGGQMRFVKFDAGLNDGIQTRGLAREACRAFGLGFRV